MPARRDWQRRWLNVAGALLPDELQLFHQGDANGTPMRFFFDLLPLSEKAHVEGDENKLRAIYSFATWCSGQSEKVLWNAAALAFWEHVFDRARIEVVASWVSPDVRRDVASLWDDDVNEAIRKHPQRKQLISMSEMDTIAEGDR